MLSLFFPLLDCQYFQSRLNHYFCISQLFFYIFIDYFASFHFVKAAHSVFKVFVTILFYPHTCTTEKKRFSWVHNGLCFIIADINKTFYIIDCIK